MPEQLELIAPTEATKEFCDDCWQMTGPDCDCYLRIDPDAYDRWRVKMAGDVWGERRDRD